MLDDSKIKTRVKKKELVLPDHVEIPSYFASTIEREYQDLAIKYNSLEKTDPERENIYKRLEDLRVEQLFD